MKATIIKDFINHGEFVAGNRRWSVEFDADDWIVITLTICTSDTNLLVVTDERRFETWGEAVDWVCAAATKPWIYDPLKAFPL